jgi:hypothetical protein
MKPVKLLFFFCLLVIAAIRAQADVITINGGRTIDCLVLQQTDASVLVRLKYGTMDIPKDQVEKIEIKSLPGISTLAERERAKTRAATNPSLLASRLPTWADAIDSLAPRDWAKGLVQIPATVVTNGALRFTPYLSHRCGTAYEMNVYGDPDFPCCVEIGVRGDLLNSVQAKQNCIDYIGSIMTREADANAVRTIGMEKKLIVVDGLTIEITPPTDPDAYGGWWISVYLADLVDRSRATAQEMQYLTIAKEEIEKKQGIRRDTLTPSTQKYDPDTDWTPTDVSDSRGGSNGGDVYVRGYTRANGTYVSSYTRSSPGSGMGRGGGHR